MEDNNFGQNNIRNSTRVSNPFHFKTTSVEEAYHKTQTQRGKHVSRGHRRFTRKRGNKRNTTSTGRIPVNGVFGQTVDQNSTNIQSQIVKPIYKEREIQVGRTGSSEDNDTAKRLFHEVGPHRRVLISSNNQQSSEISPFSTRQQTVRISVSPVRSYVDTYGLYHVAETRDVVTPFKRTSCGKLYFDDLLILHQNPAELRHQFQLVMTLLMNLGFKLEK